MVLKEKGLRVKDTIGQIFTPKYIAEFMVKNLFKILKDYNKDMEQLKVLEPSVGQGVFLKYLLQNNFPDITAYELDKDLKDQLVNNYPHVKFRFENVLGSDLNEKFDVIIGNPPYLGQNYNAEIFQDYSKKFPICDKYFVGNMDLFYYFIHLGILKLNPGGFLSFITTDYWITKSKKTGIKLLKPHIIDECFLIQYINLSQFKLFKGAEGQHNCIFVLQRKTEQEKLQNNDKPIKIIQVHRRKDENQTDESYNKKIFMELINHYDSNEILRFDSALTNNDLKREGSWNLIYFKEVKNLVDKIEKFCTDNGEICLLKDYFIIRNGLIFIKDDIFILKENFNLKIEENDLYIKVNNKFQKINDNERERLKKVYKSKSIKPYGFLKNDHLGYAIYFNKNEFTSQDINERNKFYETKYPVLTKYLKQFEDELKRILINAKENLNDLYFPRRGTFIRRLEADNKEELIDLEPMYKMGKKIFFKYISSNNIFGYTNAAYLATSDTYFLWPKSSDVKIDYLFILAYLNSKLVYFLFKAKNIKIKRSKTKLEYGLTIPNLNNFNSEKEKSITSLIKFLSSCLIEISRLNNIKILNKLKMQISTLKYFNYFNQNELMHEITLALENVDDTFLIKTIDHLFFQLFNLKEEEINYLINKYYQL